MDGATGMEVGARLSKIFSLIKRIFLFIFHYIEESGRKMNEAEERLMFGDSSESKEK